jgi:rapamycin-insensitive companion of mTOR
MALKQPVKPMIRNAIYDIIGEILNVGIKNIPKNNSDMQIQYLVNYYLMFAIKLLLDCKLSDVLIELAGLEDPDISAPAQKYLKHLSYLNFTLLSDK